MSQAVSLLNVAEGALEALSGISFRQSELAARAANGSYSTVQRRALDAEARALSDEFTRITSSATYNGLRLFGNDAVTSLWVQAGGSAVMSAFGASVARVTGDGTFGAGTVLPTTDSYSTSVTDVDNDGRPDLVAVTSNGIAAFLGNGDGTFKAPFRGRSPAGLAEYHVDTGDFDGDGKADIAGAAEATLVFMGNGDGTFRAVRTVASPGNRNWIRVADMNGDGRNDLVAGEYSGGSVFVSLGNGDGTFRAGVSSAAAYGVQYGDLGDVNGDGRPDLVVPAPGLTRSALVLLGNGDGSFRAAASYGGHALQRTTFVDVDRDGRQDIVYSQQGNVAVGVLFGNGDGTFKAPLSTPVGGPSTGYDSVIGDVDGDGEVDVVTSLWSPDGLIVLLGNGDGSFRLGRTVSGVAADVEGMSLADLNGDGAADLVSGGAGGSSLRVFVVNIRRDVGGVRLDLTTSAAARPR